MMNLKPTMEILFFEINKSFKVVKNKLVNRSLKRFNFGRNISLGFFVSFMFLFSSLAQITENTTFSILTVGPGKELYSTFGHTALRVRDESMGLDYVYNYGGFNFNTPGFYTKFLRGQLPYMVDREEFTREFAFWQYDNRMILEQTLNLTLEQKQRIFKDLTINMLPENRYYSYKFFYDNCSTRIKDIILKSLGDSVSLTTTLNADMSYRQWIDSCARDKKPWANFGMQLAIGAPSDEITGAKGATFLPMNLMLYIDSTKVMRNGRKISLVQSKFPVVPVEFDAPEKLFFTPMLVASLLLVFTLIFTFWQFKNQKKSFLLDKILFSFVGICGWFLSFLWFGTDHGVTVNNLNLIWAFPPLFPVALFLRRIGTRQWISKHFFAYACLNITLIICWKFLPQEIPNAMIPVVMALIIRALWVWWRLRRVL